jgi:hypothetical protein
MPTRSSPLRHFLLGEQFRGAQSYKSKSKVMSDPVPDRPRQSHGSGLQAQLTAIQTAYSLNQQQPEPEDSFIREKGLVIEIVVTAKFAEETVRLDRTDRLQLLNQRPLITEDGQVLSRQTWFVPDGHLGVLTHILEEYLTHDTRFGRPSHQSLVDSIESLKMAALEQLWTEVEPLPADDEDHWWEVWLRAAGTQSNRGDLLQQFRQEAGRVGLRTGEQVVRLPEHTILAVGGTLAAFRQSVSLLNCMAELRIGRNFAGDFDNMPVQDQQAWAAALQLLLEPEPSLVNPRSRDERVALCVMDTGVNRGHPLIAERLPETRNLTIKDDWGSFDHYAPTGHGTPMTGLCLYGDLTEALNQQGRLSAPFVLEAVKIVPPEEEGNDEEKMAAGFTQSGIYLMESTAPYRKRIWCIATSLEQPEVSGKPGSWSAVLDSLAAGADDDVDTRQRLICLAAGNVPAHQWAQYPQSNEDCSAHPPAQAWNVLAIGSYTQLDQIRTATPVTEVLALRGGMAPTNSTSCTWDTAWPNKPDVVFEGGNAQWDAARSNVWQAVDLSLLSTAADHSTSPFCLMLGTSPATALAARMAAQIQATYPDFWPETVRGLIVHSARWTPAMLATVARAGKQATSALLRKVGYGVPRLELALESARSRATLIAQTEIQPFRPMPKASAEPQMNELHTHSLPWPREKLLEHSLEKVRMRVTLSYFIEPNPGNRGYTSTYRYASCQLRFKVSSPRQSLKDLLADVDKAAHESQADDYVKGSTDRWLLDSNMVNKGSVHSNVWEGSAAELADMQHVVIYPVTGWWKTRKALKRAGASLRYSLLVTLEAENPALDIYTEIENAISVPVAIDGIG